MVQLSLRIDEELHRHATRAARESGTSLNAYVTRVLRIAVDPHESEPDADRVRARLAAAGLLESAAPPPAVTREPADEAAFRAAFERTRGGTPGSVLIERERAEGR